MKKEIKCLKKDSINFPEKLKKLKRCPKEIFVLGDEKILFEFSLSVIGSRRCSNFSKEIARQITGELALKNITIVSGFARGIDTIAHKECIKNKKKTIVVLGCGHNKIYPNENKYLVDEIIENGGAIISEYPCDYPPLQHNFIERNRIIAALSDGVILIEAKLKSGSLHTIKFARELNKKIFVVPGALNEHQYEGSNAVLVEGGYCVRNAKDVLKTYDFYENENVDEELPSKELLITEYGSLLKVLDYFPSSLEDICLKIKEPVNKVLSQLTLLEMEGVIKQIEHHQFVKIK